MNVLVNVIGKIAKFILNLPEMIINASIVMLTVALQLMKILKKAVDVICVHGTESLGWGPL